MAKIPLVTTITPVNDSDDDSEPGSGTEEESEASSSRKEESGKRTFADDEAEVSGDEDEGEEEYDEEFDSDADTEGEPEEHVPALHRQRRENLSVFRKKVQDDDDDELNAFRKKFLGSDYLIKSPIKKKNVVEKEEKVDAKSFFDVEAELSDEDGVEVSSDEEDDDKDDEHLPEEGNAEDLPSEDEQHDLNARVFNKQELDEEKRQILILQEKYVRDEEVAAQRRQKNFRWNNVENDVWLDHLADSDDEEEEANDTAQFELDQGVVIKFKSADAKTTDETQDQVDEPSISKDSFPVLKNNFGTMRAFSGPANSILSYVVRDKRTHAMLSTKAISPKVPTKRPIKKLRK
ncbi:hypothetical protein HDE_10026 [Halotydeus destructor]|nr:hypothetical protein HDE_10026 [Halotydeus destructor]